MRVSALAENRRADAESAHENRENRCGGERRRAENQTELPHPYRLINECARAGAEQQRRSQPRAQTREILRWVEFLDASQSAPYTRFTTRMAVDPTLPTHFFN